MPTWWEPSKTWTVDDLIDPTPKHAWADRYVEQADELGIEKVVTWGIVWRPYECRQTVEEVAEIVGRHPERIVPFHCGDPYAGKQGVDDLQRSVEQYGFKGMKVFPSYNWMRPDDERIFPLYEKAAELGIILSVHTGFTFNHRAYLEFHHPQELDRVCARFPELTVYATHSGFHWVNELMTLMFKYPKLHGDLAWFMLYPKYFVAQTLAWAKHFGFIDRFMYGSDYPLTDPKTQGLELFKGIQAYQEQHEVGPTLTDDDIALLTEGNGRRLLESVGVK
jgi:predicted TIM-barrel fold metal-dependent hydrolase